MYIFARSSSNVSDRNESESKSKSKPKSSTYNAKIQHMNDRPDHLFYFVQVSTRTITYLLLLNTDGNVMKLPIQTSARKKLFLDFNAEFQ